MPRSSSKSIAKISSQTNVSFLDENSNDKDLSSLERKIVLATEGFTTHKFCELVLKDRNRLSKENALTICDYIIAMRTQGSVTKDTLYRFCQNYRKLLGLKGNLLI